MTSVLSTCNDNATANLSTTNNYVSAISNSNVTNISSRNVLLPSIPPRAFARSNITSKNFPPDYLPSYSIVVEDMPPEYPVDQEPLLDSPPNDNIPRIDDSFLIEPLMYLAPVQPQQFWPITKRLYIYGFIIWPLWLIGSLFVLFGNEYKFKKQETNSSEGRSDNKFNTGRLKWAKRCLFNFLIFASVSIYICIALNKSKGKLY
ncbi:16730_t:CDS:1 [Funneliformis geosporum]|uniref:5916_t:CDS:1 n=1 Tax=Funneliformis geosporum TaxID=1117311 RepID=A0A9W4SBD0_9GLOM|nr:16730_t:CDS:1 [Funneliformis geosporum]CAI2163100.1 5916_t:CDS:1 [Funneliformis geosporum]